MIIIIFSITDWPHSGQSVPVSITDSFMGAIVHQYTNTYTELNQRMHNLSAR